MAFEIRRYRTATGDEPFTQWLSGLADRQAQARILVRLERLEVGNFGDARFLATESANCGSIGGRATGSTSAATEGR